MARIPEYPPILMGTAEQRTDQLREFLMRMVRASIDQGDFDADAESIEQLQEVVTALQSVLAQVQTDLGEHERNKNNPHEVTAEQLGLADVATSGSYEDLTDTPEIPEVPTALSELTDNLGSSPVHTHSQYAESDELSAVATSGDYNDLQNKPVIPPSVGVDTAMSDTSENAVQNKVIKAYVDGHTPQIAVDTAMSSSSTNAVQNKVIKDYVDSHIPSLGDLIETQEFTGDLSTISAGQTVSIYMSVSKAGYVPIGIGGIMFSKNGDTVFDNLDAVAWTVHEYGSLYVGVKNTGNSSLSGYKYRITIIYKKAEE